MRAPRFRLPQREGQGEGVLTAACPVGVLALALLLVAAPAAGHDAAATVVRELVRLQGYRAPAPAGVAVQRELTVVVLGQPLRFAAQEWRRFGLSAEAAAPEVEPTAVTLQGERALLRQVATARDGQQVTILAERRSGRADLFVLAVDRCPHE